MKILLLIIFISLLFLGNGQEKKIVIDTVCFNSNENEFGVSFIGQKMFVVSASNPTSEGKLLIDEITGKIYTDLFEVSDCNLVPAMLESSQYNQLISINSTFNDGPLHSNPSGDLVFFTNNAFSEKNKLGIFYSLKTADGKWTSPIGSPMNSPTFNVTHPHYDESTKTLYFASDKTGDYNIYQVIFDRNNWKDPKEVELVNSKAADCFPFVRNNKLYFTSNREGGFGAFDLYALDSSKTKNLGEPYNSLYDDLAIYWITDTSAYFSSNRNSEGVHDDVFYIEIQTIPLPPIVISKDSVPISDSIISKFKAYKNVTFAFDRFTISENQKPYLLEIAAEMKNDEGLYLIVSGHTDNVGKASYNQLLSQKRADEVKKFLVNNGIEENRIIAKGYGLSKPLESNSTVEGRALNRRVEFKLLEERK